MLLAGAMRRCRWSEGLNRAQEEKAEVSDPSLSNVIAGNSFMYHQANAVQRESARGKSHKLILSLSSSVRLIVLPLFGSVAGS